MDHQVDLDLQGQMEPLVTGEFQAFLAQQGHRADWEPWAHKEKEETLENPERKALLDPLVFKDLLVPQVNEDNEERKVRLENREHLELLDDLETKDLQDLLDHWDHQDLQDYQGHLAKLDQLGLLENVGNVVLVVPQDLLDLLAMLGSQVLLVYRVLPDKKDNLEAKDLRAIAVLLVCRVYQVQ